MVSTAPAVVQPRATVVMMVMLLLLLVGVVVQVQRWLVRRVVLLRSHAPRPGVASDGNVSSSSSRRTMVWVLVVIRWRTKVVHRWWLLVLVLLLLLVLLLVMALLVARIFSSEHPVHETVRFTVMEQILGQHLSKSRHGSLVPVFGFREKKQYKTNGFEE